MIQFRLLFVQMSEEIVVVSWDQEQQKELVSLHPNVDASTGALPRSACPLGLAQVQLEQQQEVV